MAESGQELAEPVFFAFADVRRPILQMQSTHASLEDVFIELTNSAAEPDKPAAPDAADSPDSEPEKEAPEA